jgi:Fe-Mn family superoxide dismutase
VRRGNAPDPNEKGARMRFELPPLPYPLAALEPAISRRTLELHYHKHHAGYVDKLNELVAGTPLAGLGLEEVIRRTAADGAQRQVFENAAQAWNHAFFWSSMTPGGGSPGGALGEKLRADLGGIDAFRKLFLTAAAARFGSGWVWLVLDRERLAVVHSANAENPLVHAMTPLLVCDVWEHAYYLDYQHRRADYVKAFLDHLVDWRRAEAALERRATSTED